MYLITTRSASRNLTESLDTLSASELSIWHSPTRLISDSQAVTQVTEKRGKSKDVLTYQGFEINFKDKELVNLTSMWKAAGMVHHKKPYFWLRDSSTKEFIGQIQRETKSHELVTLFAGRNGGTYAHWQIFLAYAKYLSPDFHMWANQVVKERFEEMVDPDQGSSATNRADALGGNGVRDQLKGASSCELHPGLIVDTSPVMAHQCRP